MGNRTGADTAVPQSSPQPGQPAAKGSASANPLKPQSAKPNAGAGASDSEATLVNGLFSELTDPPAPFGNPEQTDGEDVLSHDEGNNSGDAPPGADGDDADPADPNAEADGDASEEGDDDAAGAEGEEGEGDRDTRVPLKRLNREVARRKALETSLQALRAEVEQLKGGAAPERRAGSSGGKAQVLEPWNPLANDANYRQAQTSLETAESELDAAQRLMGMLDDDPEGVADRLAKAGIRVPAGANERVLNGILNGLVTQYTQQVAESRADIRAQERAAKQQMDALRGQWEPMAQRHFPWLQSEDDPRAAAAAKILQDHRWIEQLPNGKFVIGALVEKLHAIRLQQARAAQQTKGATTGGGVPRIRPGATAGAPGRSTANRADRIAAAQKRLEEHPSESSLADALAAEL